MSDDVWRFGDELGPKEISFLHDAATGLRAIVVVDNSPMGPCKRTSRESPAQVRMRLYLPPPSLA